MSNKIKVQLARLKVIAREIRTQCNCILDDIDDFAIEDDLFVIEQGFVRVKRMASEGYDVAQMTWDYFEEVKQDENN